MHLQVHEESRILTTRVAHQLHAGESGGQPIVISQTLAKQRVVAGNVITMASQERVLRGTRSFLSAAASQYPINHSDLC
jgi:hypothetical protein